MFLRTHSGETGALLQDLLISVTNFFRDQDAFAALQSHLKTIFSSKTPQDTVRVWVPACATGEEAYALAILLSEYARTLDSPPLIQVFATDLHDEVIQSARNGVYPETIAADVSEERLRRFFVKEHNVYRIRREIREMVMFATHDLLKDSPFSRIDLISCRNLLIYLDRSAQNRAFDIFHFSLVTGGLLFLGLSESIDDGAIFGVLDKKNRIYVHRATHRPGLPVLPGPSSLALALRAPLRQSPVLPGPAFRTLGEGGGEQADVTGPRQNSWGGLHSMVVDWLAPPSLLVNGDHEIVHISEKAGQYLKYGGGEPSRTLMQVIHPMLRTELRAVLYRATQTKAPAEAQAVPVDLEGNRGAVDIRVIPADELAENFLLVTFNARSSPLVKETVETAPAPGESASKHLEAELQRLQVQLRDTVEQHEASTEELKASNEELQAMNEELRSATEELETSREELQSINEELTTVNQELKANVDELGHANSDLHNLMASTAIATVFLDKALRITRYTPSAVELFNLIPTDVGRPLTDLTHRLDYAGLERDAERVLENLVPIEREVGRGGGRWFLARLLPYRTVDDRIAGVVLTFVDVTDLRNARDALRTSEERARMEEERTNLLRGFATAQEDERNRVARDLHDTLGQHLAALAMGFRTIETIDSCPAPIREQLRQMQDVGRRLDQEIDRLTHALRPLALSDLGLEAALRHHAEVWSRETGIDADIQIINMGSRRLSFIMETTVYRVVQEALTNVQRHASARHVSVVAEGRPNDLRVIVEDDGNGFDTENPDALDTGRLGMKGMRERAALVGGSLQIESAPGKGTTIYLTMPLAG